MLIPLASRYFYTHQLPDLIMSNTYTALVLIASLMLCGCESTSYILKPPVSDQGRLCVAQCAANKESCRGHETQRAQREKAICERTADTVFQACMSKATTKDMEKECEKKRKGCWSYEDFDRCDSEYRECFVLCGGSVEEHKQ